MKRHKLLTCLALSVLLTACAKRGDYDCICANGVVAGPVSKTRISNKTERQAKNICGEHNGCDLIPVP